MRRLARADRHCLRTSRVSRRPRRSGRARSAPRSDRLRSASRLAPRWLRSGQRPGELEPHDGLLRRAEGEPEMAERLGREKRHVVVAALLEHTLGGPHRRRRRPSCSYTRLLRARFCPAKRGCPTVRPPPVRRGRGRAQPRGFRGVAPCRRGGTAATVERSRRPCREHAAADRSAPRGLARARRSTFRNSASEASGWSRTRRSTAEPCATAARSAVLFASVSPSNPSPESRVMSTSAARASSFISSAKARAISEWWRISPKPSNIQRRHAAAPSWAGRASVL